MKTFFFKPTDPEIYLWKYLTLSKFIDLVSTSTLNLTRSDYFGDYYEAISFSYRVLHSLEKEATNQSKDEDSPFDKLLNNLKKSGTLDSEKVIRSAQRKLFVLSLHENSFESKAMWDLYSNREGVAIKFNSKEFVIEIEKCCHKYCETLINKPQIAVMDRVKYINMFDTTPETGSKNDIFLQKDKVYEYEKEVRFLLQFNDELNNINQKYHVGDLFKTVLEIRVHPKMSRWQIELIKTVLKKLNVEIAKSVIPLK